VGHHRVLPDPCAEGALYGSEVYLTSMGTRSGSILKGFLIIKKIIIIIKKKVLKTVKERWWNLSLSFAKLFTIGQLL
jgi:hypothetical protein